MEGHRGDFTIFNKGFVQATKSAGRLNFILNNHSKMVDYLYKDIHKMTPAELSKLEALEKTTPFDRR